MTSTPPTRPPGIVLALCYIGFVSLGLPDTLIGVAWPSVRETFGLDQGAVAWIFIGSGCSYFVSSFFAGRLLKMTSVGVLLALSTGLVALSAFDYSLARTWLFFAAGALLHGLGSGAIDSGLNHYVATHFSARHMNWLHACYSLGAMLGPILMTATITHSNSFRPGYLMVAVILLILSLLFFATRSRWRDPVTTSPVAVPELSSEPDPAEIPTAVTEPSPTNAKPGVALRHPLVWLHIVLFFVYTGVEVAVGQWSFTVLTESRSIDPELAGAWVTIYWASILAGRIIFGFVIHRIRIDTLIRLSTVAALAGTSLFAWNPFPAASPIALALAGLGLAVIFPCLMTRTPERFGKEITAHVIGFQVGAAMLGAAALPSATGFIAQTAGLHLVPPAMVTMAVALFVLHEIVLAATRTAEGGR